MSTFLLRHFTDPNFLSSLQGNPEDAARREQRKLMSVTRFAIDFLNVLQSETFRIIYRRIKYFSSVVLGFSSSP